MKLGDILRSTVKLAEGISFPRRAILVDFDGTLCDPYADFCKASQDHAATPKEDCLHIRQDTVDKVRQLAGESGAKPVILSFRTGADQHRLLLDWAAKAEFPVAAIVVPTSPVTDSLGVADGRRHWQEDFKKDVVAGLLERGVKIVASFDDNEKVVKLLSALGVDARRVEPLVEKLPRPSYFPSTPALGTYWSGGGRMPFVPLPQRPGSKHKSHKPARPPLLSDLGDADLGDYVFDADGALVADPTRHLPAYDPLADPFDNGLDTEDASALGSPDQLFLDDVLSDEDIARYGGAPFLVHDSSKVSYTCGEPCDDDQHPCQRVVSGPHDVCWQHAPFLR